MSTARDIVEKAYRKLGIKAEHEALSADELSNGVSVLNDMLSGWKLFAIDISHTDLASGDTFPLAREFEEGTAFELANRLAPEFEISGRDSERFFQALQASYMTITASTLDTGLTNTPGKRRVQ